MSRRLVLTVSTVVLVVATLAGCGDSGGGGTASGTTTTAAPVNTSTAGSGAGTQEPTTTTTSASDQEITVLVSNDDGYGAPGIDALVEALRTVDGVKVTVVAPLEQQSGTGGQTTPGELAVTDVKLASDYPAKAVDGFPADAIRVAFEDLDVTPDVVITGINEGQNLGPVVDFSGTVGAARAAVARGVPALATSQGAGEPVDYASAVPYVLDWLEEFRAGRATDVEPDLDHVDNLNVPSCATGEVRGLLDVPPDLDGDIGAALAPADCTSTTPKDQLTRDLAAFDAGYATLDEIPAVA